MGWIRHFISRASTPSPTSHHSSILLGFLGQFLRSVGPPFWKERPLKVSQFPGLKGSWKGSVQATKLSGDQLLWVGLCDRWKGELQSLRSFRGRVLHRGLCATGDGTMSDVKCVPFVWPSVDTTAQQSGVSDPVVLRQRLKTQGSFNNDPNWPHSK